MANILIFGDSITYGAWDEEGGWAQRLRKVIDERIIKSQFNKYHVLYNLGIPGDQTGDLIERFEQEVKARSQEEETIILFAIGINDSSYHNPTGSLSTSFHQFQKNISQLISLAREYTEKIVFIGLTPVDELKVDPMPWYEGYSYKNDHIRKYDEAIQDRCKKENIPFIPVFQEWVKTDYKKLLIDGVHPNTKGHEVLFEIVYDYLIGKEII